MDYTENLFLEFTRNITTSENFQNYQKEDVKTIYKKASLLKDNEYFWRNRLLAALHLICHDSFIKKKFDYQSLLLILCIDPNLELIKLVYNNKSTNKSIREKALEEFKIGPRYLKEFVKLELAFRRNFDFDLLEDVTLQEEKENYPSRKI